MVLIRDRDSDEQTTFRPVRTLEYMIDYVYQSSQTRCKPLAMEVKLATTETQEWSTSSNFLISTT